MSLLNDPKSSLDGAFFVFSPEFSEGDYRLFEVTEEVADYIQQGGSVELKAEDDEDLVLCTEDRTYNVQRVESSNTNLLFRADPRTLQLKDADTDEQGNCVNNHEQGPAFEVVAECSRYYELEKTNGRIRKVRDLLEECPYAGPDLESERATGAKLYSFQELLERVQASQKELYNELENLDAIQMDGKWRILDDNYLFQVVEEITLTIKQLGWGMTEIDEEECLKKIVDQENVEFPQDIVRHVLKTITRPQEGLTRNLNLEKLSRIRARELLSTFHDVKSEGRVSMSTFMEAWKSVLEGIPSADTLELNLDMIKDMILVEDVGGEKLIHFFPVWRLPASPKERFKHLFSVRQRWTLDDLEPFIKDLCGPALSQGDLLLGYTRVITSKDGKDEYCAK